MTVLAVLTVGWELRRLGSAAGLLVLMGWRNADELLESCRIERFAFEQFLSDHFQLIAMAGQNLLRFVIGVRKDIFNLRIDELSGLFAAIALEGAIHARKERSVLLLGATGEANRIAHAKQTNHLAGQGRCMFEIVFSAGGHFVDRDSLRSAPAEHAADAIE